MFSIEGRSGRRRLVVVAIVAIAGLVGAACTPPPPATGDVIVRASQVPGGSANYANVPVASVPGSTWLIVKPGIAVVRSANVAYGPLGRDDWTLRCAAPITWSGTTSYSCPAGGYFRQDNGLGPISSEPWIMHEYNTLGSLTVTPGATAHRVTYAGVTRYGRSLRYSSAPYGHFTDFVDSSRVGQTWIENLELEDRDGDALDPGKDYVLFDRSDPIAEGVDHERVDLRPVDVPPPPVGDEPPPIEELYRGEVEVGATTLKAAALLPADPTEFWVHELTCDGPQSATADGSQSCPASGRYAVQRDFRAGTTDHWDLAGTLTTSVGNPVATAVFEGTRSYVRTRAADGTDSVLNILAGDVHPVYLQIQDGRPTDAAYPFPD